MNPVPTVAGTPPAAASCDPLAGLDDEGRHLFGVAVVRMARDLTAARRRIAELEAADRSHRQRIALQKQTITQLRRTADADPGELLRRIGEALGDTPAGPPPAAAKALPAGTILGAVRAGRAPLEAPRGRRDDDVSGPGQPAADVGGVGEPGDVSSCDCGMCAQVRRSLPAPLESKPEPSRAWWLRQMLSALCGVAATVGFLVGVLFATCGEYASTAATAAGAISLTVAAVRLRPAVAPTRGGDR